MGLAGLDPAGMPIQNCHCLCQGLTICDKHFDQHCLQGKQEISDEQLVYMCRSQLYPKTTIIHSVKHSTAIDKAKFNVVYIAYWCGFVAFEVKTCANIVGITPVLTQKNALCGFSLVAVFEIRDEVV